MGVEKRWEMGPMPGDLEACQAVESLFRDGNVPGAEAFVRAVEGLPYGYRIAILPTEIGCERRKQGGETRPRFGQLANLVESLLTFCPEAAGGSVNMEALADEDYVELFASSGRRFSNRFDVLQIALFSLGALGQRGVELMRDVFSGVSKRCQRLVAKMLCAAPSVTDDEILALITTSSGEVRHVLVTQVLALRTSRVGVLDQLYASNPTQNSKLLHACSAGKVQQVIADALKAINKSRPADRWSSEPVRLPDLPWPKLLQFYPRIVLDAYRNELHAVEADPLAVSRVHDVWQSVVCLANFLARDIRADFARLVLEMPGFVLSLDLHSANSSTKLSVLRNGLEAGSARLLPPDVETNWNSTWDKLLESLSMEEVWSFYEAKCVVAEATKDENLDAPRALQGNVPALGAAIKLGSSKLADALNNELIKRFALSDQRRRRRARGNRFSPDAQSAADDLASKRKIISACAARVTACLGNPHLYLSGHGDEIHAKLRLESAAALGSPLAISVVKECLSRANKAVNGAFGIVLAATQGAEPNLLGDCVAAHESVLDAINKAAPRCPTLAAQHDRLCNLLASIPSTIEEKAPKAERDLLSKRARKLLEEHIRIVARREAQQVVANGRERHSSRNQAYGLNNSGLAAVSTVAGVDDAITSTDRKAALRAVLDELSGAAAELLSPETNVVEDCNVLESLVFKTIERVELVDLETVELVLDFLDRVIVTAYCSYASSSRYIDILEPVYEWRVDADSGRVRHVRFGATISVALQTNGVARVIAVLRALKSIRQPDFDLQVDPSIYGTPRLECTSGLLKTWTADKEARVESLENLAWRILSQLVFTIPGNKVDQTAPSSGNTVNSLALLNAYVGACNSQQPTGSASGHGGTLHLLLQLRPILPADRIGAGAGLEACLEALFLGSQANVAGIKSSLPVLLDTLMKQEAARVVVGGLHLPRRYSPTASMDWFDRALTRVAKKVSELAQSKPNDYAVTTMAYYFENLDQGLSHCAPVRASIEKQCKASTFSPGRREGFQRLFLAALSARSAEGVLAAMRLLNKASKSEQGSNRLEFVNDLPWRDIAWLFLRPSELGGAGLIAEPSPASFVAEMDGFARVPAENQPLDKRVGEILSLWSIFVKQCASAVNMDRSSYNAMIAKLSEDIEIAKSLAFLTATPTTTTGVAPPALRSSALEWYKTACSLQVILNEVVGTTSAREECVLEHPTEFVASAWDDPDMVGPVAEVVAPLGEHPERVLCAAVARHRRNAKHESRYNTVLLCKRPNTLVPMLQAAYQAVGCETTWEIDPDTPLERDSVAVQRLVRVILALREHWLAEPSILEAVKALTIATRRGARGELATGKLPQQHADQALEVLEALIGTVPCVWGGVLPIRGLCDALVETIGRTEETKTKASRNVRIAQIFSEMSQASSLVLALGAGIENQSVSRAARSALLNVSQWHLTRRGVLEPAVARKRRAETRLRVAFKLLCADRSAVHLGDAVDPLVAYRQDLLGMFVTGPSEDHGVFEGSFFQRSVGKQLHEEELNDEERIKLQKKTQGFRLVKRRRVRLLRTPFEVNVRIGEQMHRDMSNPSLPFVVRRDALLRGFCIPALTSAQIVEQLEGLYTVAEAEHSEAGTVSVETQTFISTYIDNVFKGDNPLLCLAFLLSPEVIKRDTSNAAARAIATAAQLLAPVDLVKMLALALAPGRRKVLRTGVIKALVRLLAKVGTPDALELLSAEWSREDAHQDIKLEMIKIAMEFLSSKHPAHAVQWAFGLLARLASLPAADPSADLQPLLLLPSPAPEEVPAPWKCVLGEGRPGPVTRVLAVSTGNKTLENATAKVSAIVPPTLQEGLSEQYFERVVQTLLGNQGASDVVLRLAKLTALASFGHHCATVEYLQQVVDGFVSLEISSLEDLVNLRPPDALRVETVKAVTQAHVVAAKTAMEASPSNNLLALTLGRRIRAAVDTILKQPSINHYAVNEAVFVADTAFDALGALWKKSTVEGRVDQYWELHDAVVKPLEDLRGPLGKIGRISSNPHTSALNHLKAVSARVWPKRSDVPSSTSFRESRI